MKCEELFLGPEGPDHDRVQPSIIEKANKLCLVQKNVDQMINDWSQDVEDTGAASGVTFPKETNQQLRALGIGPLLAKRDVGINDPPKGSSNFGSNSRNTSSLKGSSGVEALGDFTPGAEEREVFNYLTGHEAFTTLISNFERIVEHHYVNIMELIRKRILLAIKRPRDLTPLSSHSLQAVFYFDLDIPMSCLTSTTALGKILALYSRSPDARKTRSFTPWLNTWFKLGVNILWTF